MSQPRVYRAEGIVLRGVDFGETDRVLTIFTLNHGKIRVVGKGVRQPGSRLGGHLDLLTHSQLLLARGRNLDIVTQAETIEPFTGLRDDLWRASLAYTVAELIDRLTEEGHEDCGSFGALSEALGRVAVDPDPELAVRQFEAQLLERLGYRPQLQSCVRCRVEMQRIDCYYSAAAGGVLCPACGPKESAARPLSSNAFAMLRVLQGGDFGLARRIRKDAQLRGEIEVILRDQIRYLLDRDLKSSAFLHRLRAMAVSGAD